MIRGVTAWSRQRVMATMPTPTAFEQRTAIISITDEPGLDNIGEPYAGGNWVDSELGRYRLEQHKVQDALTLCFGDFSENEVRSHPEYQDLLFNAEHARRIIEFTDRLHTQQDPVFIIVHCAAGVSRSAAVAEFIVGHYNLDYQAYAEKHRHTRPNHHVLQTLRASAAPRKSEHELAE